MAIYYLDVSVVSRGKGQNAVAKSAYNSASKIKDYNEDEYKDYSKKQCDYSEIMIPDHAPEEYKDREYLWNKVHDIEKRKDSRLAREIKIALPTELEKEDNIKLTKEFSETLKNEGMIVDINIHELDSKNPHAHLLCSLRGIDDNGEFEPKRVGNSKVRDWDNKDKVYEWRKRWSDIQNKHLKDHGFYVTVSEKSYKDRGINLKSTVKEGWLSRKYNKDTGKLTQKAEYNLKIKRENNKIIEKNTIKTDNKLDKYDYINREQSKELSSISKDLKTYISPKTLIEQSVYIDDLSSKSLLISNENKREKQNEKVEDTKNLIDKAKEIFKVQADTFFKENYNDEFKDLSDDDKIYLTYFMLENNKVINPSEFKEIIEQKIEEENTAVLNNLLSNREITHENIDKEKDFYFNKLNGILEDNNLTINDLEDVPNKNISEENYDKILYYSNRLDRLSIADNILENYYDNRINKLFDGNEESIESFKETTSIQEKKDIVDFIEFYGEDKTLYIIDSGQYNYRFNENERTEILDNTFLVTDKLNNKHPTDYDNYTISVTKKDMAEKYNINITNDNDIKHIIKESLLNNDSGIDGRLEEFQFKSEKYHYQYKPINFSDIHRNINSMVYSFSEIFKERMPKYINNQFKSKNHSKQQMNKPNRNRRNRGQGLT